VHSDELKQKFEFTRSLAKLGFSEVKAPATKFNETTQLHRMNKKNVTRVMKIIKYAD
jgi:hypothetical protein